MTLRRRPTTAHRVAISRASSVGVPISSTALIGRGGAQWYPHHPSGNRSNHAARAPGIVIPRYAASLPGATDRCGTVRGLALVLFAEISTRREGATEVAD